MLAHFCLYATGYSVTSFSKTCVAGFLHAKNSFGSLYVPNDDIMLIQVDFHVRRPPPQTEQIEVIKPKVSLNPNTFSGTTIHLICKAKCSSSL